MVSPLLLLLAGAAVVLVLIIFLLVRRRDGGDRGQARAPAPPPAARPAPPPVRGPAAPAPAPASEAGVARAAAVPAAAARPAPETPEEAPLTMPAALADWVEEEAPQQQRADQLPSARQVALLAELRKIPPPPRSLQRLVSPDFLAKASSGDLGTLVMGEPMVAARVIAAVNSPLYGLRQPVTSIGQAVTFLGLNSVRAICLQYMLNDSFKAGDPALKQHFERLWRASAIASELCLALAQKLRWPEAGALATQLVLSFLGQFAAASLLQRRGVAGLPSSSLLERSRTEREHLGTSAAEIGFLLMQEWGLPAAIIENVRRIDTILVMPADALQAEEGAQLALCYLCARLGERIVHAGPQDLSVFDPEQEAGADFHCLRSYLAQPALVRLMEYVRSADTARVLERMA